MVPLGNFSMASISRRGAVAAVMTVVPLVAALEFWAPAGVVRWLAPIWGLLAVLIYWGTAASLSRRIGELVQFANATLDSGASRPRLQFYDDELGDLARSLSKIAPKVEEAVRGLSTELARRESILASMTEAVLAVDAKLNVSFCNDAFVRAVGHSIEKGVPLIKVFRDPGLFQILRLVVDSGENLTQRLNISVHEDQWFDVHATPLAGDTPHGALAILYDVTPIARMERAQRDFVANVSHEFRTPLATITGCAETLLHEGSTDAKNGRKFLEIIHANSVRLTHIAADLIMLSQLDTGQGRPETMPIPVEESVASALHAIEPVAVTRGVKIYADPICPAQVLGHRLALEQALVNLLDNAVKFSQAGGEVSVQTEITAGDQVEISVSDRGIGIPKEDLSRIFERFYRVDKARSRSVGGTGLGLSIVKHAVEQMHGTVRVESQLGKGSCFTIALPRHRGAGSS